MWELNCKEDWTLKSRCFWVIVLEKILENPLDCKRSNQSILKETNPEYSLEGLMLKLKLQYVCWPLDVKSWLTGKDSDAGRDWGQEEKSTTEDEMAGWHHGLDGHESEWTPGAGDGQEAWCVVIHGVTKSWTWLSDWTELIYIYISFNYVLACY